MSYIIYITYVEHNVLLIYLSHVISSISTHVIHVNHHTCITDVAQLAMYEAVLYKLSSWLSVRELDTFGSWRLGMLMRV